MIHIIYPNLLAASGSHSLPPGNAVGSALPCELKDQRAARENKRSHFAVVKHPHQAVIVLHLSSSKSG